MLRDISYDKATLISEGKESIHSRTHSLLNTSENVRKSGGKISLAIRATIVG